MENKTIELIKIELLEAQKGIDFKKPSKPKPDPTRNARQRTRYVKQVDAAIRDGFDGRSEALTAWAKGEAVLVRVEDKEHQLIHRETKA